MTSTGVDLAEREELECVVRDVVATGALGMSGGSEARSVLLICVMYDASARLQRGFNVHPTRTTRFPLGTNAGLMFVAWLHASKRRPKGMSVVTCPLSSFLPNSSHVGLESSALHAYVSVNRLFIRHMLSSPPQFGFHYRLLFHGINQGYAVPENLAFRRIVLSHVMGSSCKAKRDTVYRSKYSQT